MEHPLIPSIDHLSVEDLGKKISELQKKLSIAARTGNGYLCDQIRMAIETYQTKYQAKMAEMYNKPVGGNDFLDKIDIS